MADQLLLKRVQPGSSKMSLFFRLRSLCVLLGLTMMGHLVAGYKTGADSVCSSCSSISAYSQSFTIRNALPQANSNLHMVCSIWSDCGGFSTYSADIPCKSIEVPINDQSACSCTSTPGVEQVVCEFVWTKPNDEWFVRAQVLVWSRESEAPKKTFYIVDDAGFWFSSSPDATLSKIGSCEYIPFMMSLKASSTLRRSFHVNPFQLSIYRAGGNYLSSETSIMGRVGQVKGFGRNHCRIRS